MKKIFNFIPLLLVFYCLSFCSCKREIDFGETGDELGEFTVDDAKKFYVNSMNTRGISSEKGVGFKNRDFDDVNITPLWNSAKNHYYKGQSYLEVPFNLNNKKKYLFYSKLASDSNSIQPSNEKKSEGVFRLIFEKKRDGSKIGYFFLAFGDSINVAKSGQKPVINIFGQKTGFSGFEEFHFLNGEFSHAFQHNTDNNLSTNVIPKLQTRLLELVCTPWTYTVCSSYGCDTYIGGYDCHWINTGGSGDTGNPCSLCGNNGGTGGDGGSTNNDNTTTTDPPEKCRCLNASRDSWLDTKIFYFGALSPTVEPYLELTGVKCRTGGYQKFLHYISYGFVGCNFDTSNDNASEWFRTPINPQKPNCGYNITFHAYGTITFHATIGVLEEINKVQSFNTYISENLD
jgi:hypothetical protein